jgi:hypothetical protein
MDVTTSPIMIFDLQSLITTVPGLDELVLLFEHEEIDSIAKHMPIDKASGPDGFNGMFMKRFWQIIKQDFYSLCDEFNNGIVNLECINSSYITLVPKTSNPETVNDFRPISLLNISLKLLTKNPGRHITECHSQTHSLQPIWFHSFAFHSRLSSLEL